MLNLPLRIRYDIYRRERLLAHLYGWYLCFPYIALALGLFLWFRLYASLWFWFFSPLLLLIAVHIFQGLVIGFIDIAIHPVWHMEFVLEENKVSLYMEGVLVFHTGQMANFTVTNLLNIVWTMTNESGRVINIPYDAITEEQVQCIKDMLVNPRNRNGEDTVSSNTLEGNN
jgi:hypothetical protein